MLELDRIDLPALATALGQRLRAAGLPSTPERASRFAQALALVAPLRRAELYWTARSVFVSSQAQLPTFDRVFAAVFDPALEPDEERGDPYSPALSSSRASDRPPVPDARSVPGERSSDEGGGMRGTMSRPRGDRDAREVEVPLATASEEERLRKKSFESLDSDELKRIRRLMAALELAAPQRRSRRRRRARRGEHLDLRRTLRNSLRTGGDPMTLASRSRRTRPRRLVLLCDISGSMEPYARAYLHLLTSAVASGAPAEAFVFATRLTRLTRALGGRNPEAAIQRAIAAAPDWSSGTRIGEALRTFNDRYGRRGMARGAVAVILSDGWERADPTLLGREMERLARLAHRIVWVNPRVGAPGFSPGAGGMAAALPHCDALVSGHSVEALDQVAEAIASGDLRSEPVWTVAHEAAEGTAPSWPSAERTEAQRPVPMPSGYGPKRGRTTE
ncbi:MAG TPA: VWA domain-containing protein [Solirubrobacterales bacterium]|nr:VWA domain-containing protein [Solirubrobacterales bacterium]